MTLPVREQTCPVLRTLEPEAYLTDGRRLVSSLDGSSLAELEDCLTLQVRSVTPDELVWMDLRLVRRGTNA